VRSRATVTIVVRQASALGPCYSIAPSLREILIATDRNGWTNLAGKQDVLAQGLPQETGPNTRGFVVAAQGGVSEGLHEPQNPGFAADASFFQLAHCGCKCHQHLHQGSAFGTAGRNPPRRSSVRICGGV